MNPVAGIADHKLEASTRMPRPTAYENSAQQAALARSSESTAPSAPLVSIIMPAFNAERFVSCSIESVAQQTYVRWELLVTDDASTDGTHAALERWAAQDPRIKPVSLRRNAGAAHARNASIERASGDFLAFLDSDDLWSPNKLEAQVTFMQTRGIDFSFTPYVIISEDGVASRVVVDKTTPLRVTYEDMLRKRATMGCSTVMVRRSSVGSLRMPNLRQGQDYAFWLSILRTGVVAHRLDVELTKYRKVAGSISANKLVKARRQWQIYRKLERLPLTTSMWCFFNYAVRAVIRG